MERKTKVKAEDGRQDLVITREFALPLALLFRAFTEAELLAQWMGTKVLRLESRRHGSWQIETPDAQGNVAFRASGVFHAFVPDRQIIRTFEMEGAPFGVQLEFLDFKALTEDTSRLTMQIVYRSGAQRDQLLRLPFAQGLNLAHNRLESLFSQQKAPQ